jgi:hypothetical protein
VVYWCNALYLLGGDKQQEIWNRQIGGDSRRRGGMREWIEFGFPESGEGIRKSKAGLAWMRVRRTKHQT